MGARENTMVDPPLRAPTPSPVRTSPPLAVTALWWLATLVTLVILDDLTFGPVFWLISRFGSPLGGFLAALAIYVPVQIFLVMAATSGSPGRIARFFLDRLDLDRRSQNVGDRERRLQEQITGAVSASVLSLLIGGVLPPLILWKAGYSVGFVRRLSFLTASVYAVEFALIHGFVPGTI